MNTHPEGLAFEPKGPGFTTKAVRFPVSDQHMSLLGQANVEVARKNHPEEWQAAFDALPGSSRDPRSGRPIKGLTDDERARLAALAVFVEHGLFAKDREPIAVPLGPPVPDEVMVALADQKGESCGCTDCTCS